MGRPQLGVIAVGALVAVLAVACSDGDRTADDEAEVLGIQVERDGEEVATFEPTEPDEPADATSPAEPTADAATDVPDEPVPTVGGAVTAEPTDAGDGPADAGDAGAPSDPSPEPAASPTPAPPTSLTTREGHSYLTWFRDEEPDGQGGSTYVWGEVSATPAVTREGSEPLRVTLVDLDAEPDRSAPRRAQCRSWLEVDGDEAVRAHGELTVEVVVDGQVVSAGTRSVDVTVAPGERADLLAIGDVRVAVPDVAEVSCRVGFREVAAG